MATEKVTWKEAKEHGITLDQWIAVQVAMQENKKKMAKALESKAPIIKQDKFSH